MLLLLSAGLATAQTNPPPVSYVRSYVNDVPNQPLVSVSVYGASNVSCFTIEESLPSPATAVNVSGDGVYLPALNVIRWGPYFNTVSASVSYRLTGLPASYPVNGGSWMDGQWYFSPGVTLITVLPASGGSVPTAPPQVATPVIGVAVPLTIQAESASYGGGLSIDTNYAGFNGSGFANFPLSGGFLQFTGVGGGFGGLATLSIRFALGATNTRSGLLIVNGVSQGITFSPTGNWNNWTSQVVNIPLGSGNTNIVRFESNGQDLANVDEITVTPGTNGISANFQISCATRERRFITRWMARCRHKVQCSTPGPCRLWRSA